MPLDTPLRCLFVVYVTTEARQELLDGVAKAIKELGLALARLGAAYEAMDEGSADKLEAELFRPVQVAYGRAKRTHTDFAARHGMRRRTFAPVSPGIPPSAGIKPLLEGALDAVNQADATLVELQDSLMPVEVGDAPLRAGLAEVRTLLSNLRVRTRGLERVLGR